MPKSMVMGPPLSITTLMSPTFAIGGKKLVLAAMPAKKRLSYSGLNELILKAWIEIRADSIMNGFVKAGITEKTTTIEIEVEDESVTEDIASDTETLPVELMDMIDGIGFSSELE